MPWSTTVPYPARLGEDPPRCGVRSYQELRQPGQDTRAGPPPPGEDVKTYDLGQLNVSVSNTPATFANQALGELWVSYTVELRKPKFFGTRGLAIQKDLFVLSDTAQITEPTTFDLLTLGNGQQNRIGGMLVKEYQGTAAPGTTPQYPAGAGKQYYVFPDTFSGDVEVIINSCVVTDGNIVVISSDTGAPGILNIKDMWTGTSWTPEQGSGNSADKQGLMRYHLRITSPTSAQSALGQDNVLVVNGGADQIYTGASVEVTVYNTGLNNQRTGLPMIANPTTEMVEDWP